MYYLSIARAPEVADKVYAHKLQKHFAYEPKLSPCVINFRLEKLSTLFFVYMIRIFIMRLLNALKTEHTRVGEEEDFWRAVTLQC